MDENMTNQVEESVESGAEINPEEQSVETPPKQETIKSKLSTKTIAIIAVAVVAVIALFTFVLGGNGGASGNSNTGKEAQFKSANDAYIDIVSASETCIEIMDSIYGAWHFAIYKADDYYGTNKIKEFASAASLTYSEVNSAMTSLGLSSSDIDDFNYAIYIVKQVYKNKGSYTEAKNLLASAKDSLKSVTSEYSDYTGYPTLKSFYSEVSSYLEFAESPSGSFSQLKTTIDNYETNIRTYKNDLSFIFD